MFLLNIVVVGIANIGGTYTETDVPKQPKGPCPGIEFKTKFNILSFFMNVEDEIYCVDGDGNVVDCELSCSKEWPKMLGVGKCMCIPILNILDILYPGSYGNYTGLW